MKELLNVSHSFAQMLLGPTIKTRKVHVGLGAKPFPPLVFDRLQYSLVGLADLVMSVVSMSI